MSPLIDGCSTFSKRVQSYVQYVTAPFVVRGTGNYLRMCDGKTVFDTISGLGSNLWECHNNYSMSSIKEEKLAELILQKIPYHSQLKFVKTGSAACEAAVRYARACTGKNQILMTGYHGCSDMFVNVTPPALGTIYGHVTRFEKMEELLSHIRAFPTNTAAAIIEPLELDISTVTRSNSGLCLLEQIRDACTRAGILLIYDEIITGWRIPGYTVANYSKVYPDISTLGKALGGGHALGIVAVCPQVAEGIKGTFISNTHNGEECALDAALKTIKKTTSARIGNMWGLSTTFRDMVNGLTPHLQLRGYPARYVWECKDDIYKAKIWQHLYDNGYLAGAAFFPKLSWCREDYHKLYCHIAVAVSKVDKIKLRGIPPQPVFRRNS